MKKGAPSNDAPAYTGATSSDRAVAWRVIFQTVHLKRDDYREDIERKKRKYRSLMIPSGHVSEKVRHQIEIDIKRLDAEYKMFNGIDASQMYYDILGLIAHRRPPLGYVQGMADILAPFVILFMDEDPSSAESSAYYCYTRLLDEIQHNILDMQSALMHRLSLALETADSDFYHRLRESGIEVHMFAFRWFSCFFTREFRFPVLFKVLDFIFVSDDINFSLLCIAVALLMNFKRRLAENDFASNILFLQNLSEREWEDAEVDMLLSASRLYYKTLDN
jgi:TBC1 domain family member 2